MAYVTTTFEFHDQKDIFPGSREVLASRVVGSAGCLDIV